MTTAGAYTLPGSKFAFGDSRKKFRKSQKTSGNQKIQKIQEIPSNLLTYKECSPFQLSQCMPSQTSQLKMKPDCHGQMHQSRSTLNGINTTLWHGWKITVRNGGSGSSATYTIPTIFTYTAEFTGIRQLTTVPSLLLGNDNMDENSDSRENYSTPQQSLIPHGPTLTNTGMT